MIFFPPSESTNVAIWIGLKLIADQNECSIVLHSFWKPIEGNVQLFYSVLKMDDELIFALLLIIYQQNCCSSHSKSQIITQLSTGTYSFLSLFVPFWFLAWV